MDSNSIPFSGSDPLNAFDRSDSGYQFTLGVRGLQFLGAEIDHLDLGSGSVSHPYPLAGNPRIVNGARLVLLCHKYHGIIEVTWQAG